VKVYLDDGAGKELILAEIGPGDYFGELALLGDSPRTASVSTVTECEVRMLAASAFDRLLAERPALARHLIRHLARRVGDLIDKARDLGLRSTYERIAKVLEEVAVNADDPEPDAPWITHQGIADRAGCSREMVSRILGDLRTGGYLEQRGKHFVLLRKLPPRW
jgi:CRP/FNR family cyclic AMP-dependent transcriptional regulator